MTTAAQLPDTDLIVASDGVNSRIRQEARGIHTDVHVGNNKYIWLGTDKVFDSFMFPFVQTDSGWIWAHACGVGPDSSTFIVECSAETWNGLGFDTMPPRDCLGVLEKIFERQAAILQSQLAARLTAQWFENVPRYVGLTPRQFCEVLRRRKSPLLLRLSPGLTTGCTRRRSSVPFLRRARGWVGGWVGGWGRRSSRSTAGTFGVRRYGALPRYPQKPVDERRITRGKWPQPADNRLFPVHIMWTQENLKMNCRRPLRNAEAASNNGCAVGNGATRGKPGNVRRTGQPVLHTGSWHRRPARTVRTAGQPAGLTGRGQKQGPSISYMEGPCGILPDPAASAGPTRRKWRITNMRPPSTTAPSVPAIHTRARMTRGMAVRSRRITASPAPAPKAIEQGLSHSTGS